MASIQFDASLDTSKLDKSIEDNKKSLATWLEDVRNLGAEFDQIFAKIGEAKNIDINVNKDAAIQQVGDLTSQLNSIAPEVTVEARVENLDQSQDVMTKWADSLASDFAKIDEAYWQNNESAKQSIQDQSNLVEALTNQVSGLQAQLDTAGKPGGLELFSDKYQAIQDTLTVSKQKLTEESDTLNVSMEREIGKFDESQKAAGGFNGVLKGVGASILKYASWTAIAGAAVTVFKGAIDSGSNASKEWKGWIEGLTGALGQFYTQVRQLSLDNVVPNMIKAAKAIKEFAEVVEQYNKAKAAGTILNTADQDQLNKLEAVFRNTTKSFEEKNAALQKYKEIKTAGAQQDYDNALKMVEGFETKIGSMPGLEWVTPEQLKLMETVYYESGDLMKKYYELRDATALMSDTVFLDPEKHARGWQNYGTDVQKARTELEGLAKVKGFSIADLLSVGKLETDLSEKTITGLGEAYTELGNQKAAIADVNANIARTEAMVANSFQGEIGSIGALAAHIAALEKLKKETGNEALRDQYQAIIDKHKAELDQLDPEKRRALQKEINDMRNDAAAETQKQLLMGSKDPQAELKKQLIDLKNQYDKDVNEFGLSEKKKAVIVMKYNIDKLAAYKEYYQAMAEAAKELDPGAGYSILSRSIEGAGGKGRFGFGQQIHLFPTNEEAGKLREASQASLAYNDELKQKMLEQAEAAKMLAPALFSASDAAQYLSSLFGQGNEELAGMLTAIGAIGGKLGDWVKKGYFDALSGKSMSKGEAITNIVGGATDIIGMFISQSQENKQKMKDYYEYVKNQQFEYNLLLNEQLRINSDQKGNVFINDYIGRLTDGTKAYADAMRHYNEGLAKLGDLQAKAGLKSAISGENVLRGVGAGAAIGAGVGSVIPVIGTAIGAVVGGIIGGIAGLFAKKKKDVMQPLLDVYPELIKANGDLNMSLAQTILDNDLIAEKSRAVLQNIVDWKKAAEEAEAQIESVIGDLAGALGSELGNALVQAFTDGTDSAVAFGKVVDNILSNIMAQLVFNAVFGAGLANLEQAMKDSFDPSKGDKFDQSWLDDISTWAREAKDSIPLYNQTMTEIQQAAAGQGVNLWRPETSGGQGLSNVIQRQITEETGNELAGLMRMIAEDNRGNRDYNKLAVDHLIMIEANTFQTVEELKLAVIELKVISTNTQKEYSGALVG